MGVLQEVCSADKEELEAMKNKIEEQKHVLKIYEMACQSLAPDEMEGMEKALITLCERRSLDIPDIQDVCYYCHEEMPPDEQYRYSGHSYCASCFGDIK